MITKAKVKTPHGRAYIRRLCNHFAHRIPATADGSHGRIEFPFGLCVIECDSEHMHITVDLADAGDVDRAEGVVGDHLVRMANKDDPIVIWRRKAD